MTADYWDPSIYGESTYPAPKPQVPLRGRRARVAAMLSGVHQGQNGPFPLRISHASACSSDPVYTTLDEVRESGRQWSNASLHPALQDLGDAIVRDIHDACAALDDPNLWYAGVDEGIWPVPDDHVELVIAAMQRELFRELRNAKGEMAKPRLPAVRLAELPWNVQRALAERRRLRYQQWGIGKLEWLTNQWFVSNVPEDPEWRPGA